MGNPAKLGVEAGGDNCLSEMPQEGLPLRVTYTLTEHAGALVSHHLYLPSTQAPNRFSCHSLPHLSSSRLLFNIVVDCW